MSNFAARICNAMYRTQICPKTTTTKQTLYGTQAEILQSLGVDEARELVWLELKGLDI